MVQSLMQMQNIFIHFKIFKKDYEWFKVKCKCNENLEMYISKKIMNDLIVVCIALNKHNLYEIDSLGIISPFLEKNES